MSERHTKAIIVAGRLSIDIYDLLGSLDDEERAKVIDTLACTSQIIDEVANQIIDGMTTQGSYGPTGWGGNPEATHGIDGARMRIAKASSEIAAKEIERLADAITRAKELGDKGWAAYHELLEQRRFA